MKKALVVTLVYGLPLTNSAKELHCLCAQKASAILTITLPTGRKLALCHACAEEVSMDLCTTLYGYQIAKQH